MAKDNFFVYIGKIIVRLLWDIIYFPFWWYSLGLFFIAKNLGNFLANRERSLAWFVWIKNIGKPMYQQYSWEGRIISFFVRLVQIIFRGIFLLIWLVICLFIFLLWLVIPIYAVYQIYFQIIQ